MRTIVTIAIIISFMIATPVLAQGVTGGSAINDNPGTSASATSSGVITIVSAPGPAGATGVRGYTGATGMQGPEGPAGNAGDSIVDLWRCDGSLIVTVQDYLGNQRLYRVEGFQGRNGDTITDGGARFDTDGNLLIDIRDHNGNIRTVNAGTPIPPTDYSWMWWLLLLPALLLIWLLFNRDSVTQKSLEKSETDRIALGEQLINASALDGPFSAEFTETGRRGDVSFKIRRGGATDPQDLGEMFDRKIQAALSKHVTPPPIAAVPPSRVVPQQTTTPKQPSQVSKTQPVVPPVTPSQPQKKSKRSKSKTRSSKKLLPGGWTGLKSDCSPYANMAQAQLACTRKKVAESDVRFVKEGKGYKVVPR